MHKLFILFLLHSISSLIYKSFNNTKWELIIVLFYWNILDLCKILMFIWRKYQNIIYDFIHIQAQHHYFRFEFYSMAIFQHAWHIYIYYVNIIYYQITNWLLNFQANFENNVLLFPEAHARQSVLSIPLFTIPMGQVVGEEIARRNRNLTSASVERTCASNYRAARTRSPEN